MNRRQMHAFLQVVEKRNLSEAAKELNVSQPAVTGIIKKIETDYGTELFVRNGKSLIPNTQGMLLYKMIREILFSENLGQISLDTCGRTTQFISIEIESYSDYFYSLLGKFSKFHPEYCFILKSKSFSIGNTAFTSTDFLLTSGFPAESDQRISVDVQDTLYAVLPVGHRYADIRRLPLYELKDESFIFLKGAKHEEFEPCYQECIRVGFVPRVSLIVDIPAAKYSAVAAGCGIGLTYNTKLQLAAAARNCVLVECEEIRNRQTLCLSWQEPLNEPAAVFLEWLKGYRRREGDWA